MSSEALLLLVLSRPIASSMGAQMGMTENAGPMPGIDISKLDFVNKAKSVLDASYKKDKARVGAV